MAFLARSREMIEILTDRQRDGAPVKFTAEQVTQILALACEEPSLSKRPINSWTNRELADEAELRGIVNRIRFMYTPLHGSQKKSVFPV